MELITALDFNNDKQAKEIVERAGNSVSYYKVGLELFVSSGPSIIEWLKSKGKKVFLDLKFHDIPNTASKAVLSSLEYGVDMLNIHTQGGTDMMKKCAESMKEFCDSRNIKSPLLIGVTLLTSLDINHLKEFGINFEPEEYVLKLAGFAKSSGLDGVVSSAKETKIIKDNLGKEFITVTPGIRPAGADITDQKRVVTPRDALLLGSDYIVVGRPITQAENIEKVVKEILREIKG